MRRKTETKFKMLDLKENESARIIERGKIKDIEKYVNEIETRVEEIQDLKGKMQELMIGDDKELDELGTWTNQEESDLERYN